MGFRIFLHAIRLVFNNFGPALRISALLYFVPVIVLQLIVGGVAVAYDDPIAALRSPLTILFVLIPVVAALWIAVAWHRYVIMDEMPGPVAPSFNGGRILAYLGNSLLIGLILAGLSLVLFVPLGLLAAGLAGSAPSMAGAALALLPILVGYFVLAVIGYRLTPILPASATDKPIRLGDAWSATRGASGAIVVLALLSVLGVVVLDAPGYWLSAQLSPWAGVVWQLAASWVELMVGVSIITTIYGHYVEGRPVA